MPPDAKSRSAASLCSATSPICRQIIDRGTRVQDITQGRQGLAVTGVGLGCEFVELLAGNVHEVNWQGVVSKRGDLGDDHLGQATGL